MRIFFTIAVVLLGVALAEAQRYTPETLSKIRATPTERYTADSNGYFPVQHAMPFASAVFVAPDKVKATSAYLRLVKIQLVYSDYSSHPGFSQPGLNLERLKALYLLRPDLFDNAALQWEFIPQTGCRDKACAEQLFHGFVFVYAEPLITPGFSDADFMKTAVVHQKCVVTDTLYRYRRRQKLFYLPVSERKRQKGIRYARRGIWNREPELQVDTLSVKRTIRKREIDCYQMGSVPPQYNYKPDSTIFKVLDRNMDQWKKSVVVADVTGSMSPYYAQLLVWLSLQQNLNKVQRLVFFNDGDRTADPFKKMGKTGGIYSTESGEPAEVEKIILKTISKGNGGDLKENNVEAVLHALEKFPDCEHIILIADNWAPMRDYKLIDRITKPVHVIVCGTLPGQVNLEYLELAYRTKGSVHTMNEDLDKLMELGENQRIELFGKMYRIEGGKFVPLMVD